MKIFLLICKNWIKSISKLKLIFGVFLILNFLFATTFTVFLGIREQIQEKTNFQKNQSAQNENVFTTNSFSNSSGEWDTRFYSLFCNDYVEIKSEKKEVKRLPIMTFGGPNGCFQSLSTDWNMDYKLQFKNDSEKEKIVFTNLSFKSKKPQDILKINFKSSFYQNSIHARLLAKYDQEKNQDYLDLAQELERVFYPKIIANLETEFLQRANEITNKKQIYLIEKDDEISFSTLINNLKFTENELSDYGKNSQKLPLKQYWSNLLPSQNQKERIQELLKSDKLDKQLIASKEKSKKTLKELIQYIEKWNEKNLLQAFSFDIAKLNRIKYQDFENALKVELAKSSDDKSKNPMMVIEKYIESDKFLYLFQWMKEISSKIEKNIANEETKKQINWLTAHITLIKNKIRAKIDTPQIALLNEVENLKEIQKKDNNQHSVNSKKWLLDNETKMKTNLSLKEIETFSQKIKQQKQLLFQYLEIKAFFTEKKEWIKLNPKILEKQFLNRNIEKLNVEEINHLYLLIQDKIEKLNLELAENINNIHHAIKINNDFKITGTKKTQTFFKYFVSEEKDESIAVEWKEINEIIIKILKEKKINLGIKNFFLKLENQLLVINSEKDKLSEWNKLTQITNVILDKISNYFLDDLKVFTIINSPILTKQYVDKELKQLQKELKFSQLFSLLDLNLKTTKFKKQLSDFKIILEILKKRNDLDNDEILNYKDIYITWENENFLKMALPYLKTIKLKNVTWEKIKNNSPWWNVLSISHEDSKQNKQPIKNTSEYILLHQLSSAMVQILLEKKLNEINQKDYFGNSNLEKILNINYFLAKKEKARKFYENVNFHSETINDFEKLKTSENSLKWIQKVNKKQQNKKEKENRQKFLTKLEAMIADGFDIHGVDTKIKFPQKKINNFLQKLLEPDKYIWKGKIIKTWTFDSSKYNFYKVDNELPWNEVAKLIFRFKIKIEKPNNKEVVVQLPENNLNFLNQYKKENWFNKLIWQKQVTKSITNNLLGPLTRENWTLFYKANAILNNFKIGQFKSLFIFDQKNDKKYLMIEPNDSFKINLVKGREAFLENEIVISPIFARNWNLKLGDKINLFGLKNLKIVGIGVQEQFLYQIISQISFVPQKNEGIFYPTKKAYKAFFQKKIKNSLKNYFSLEQRQILFNYQGPIKEGQKDHLNKFANMIGFNLINFTERSFELNNQMDELKEAKIMDLSLGNEKIINLNEYRHFPYKAMSDFVALNNKIIFYPPLIIVAFFVLIMGSVTFYMINQKIKNNRREMAILKSLGIKNNKILIGTLPIIMIVFATIFIGWIVGVLLQIPLFNTIESFFNLEFKRYKFNFLHLLIIFGIVAIIIIFTFIFFERFKLSKMGVIELMYGKRKVPNMTVNKIKNVLINKTGLSKYLIVKINYIFFSTVFKKMVILFLVFIITTISVLGNIFFLTVAKQTVHENYKNVNHNYEIIYSQPMWNHPLSRKKIITNYGYDYILQENNNFVAPLENEGLQVFLQENNGKPQKHKFKTVNEIMWFMLPLHWKSLNFNWLKKIVKEGENDDAEEKICLIIGDVLKSIMKVKDPKKCLSYELNQLLPFKIENPERAISQIPFSGNGVKFDPKQDELFTRSNDAYLNSPLSEDNFDVYGLNENTNAFHFSTQTKKVVFENQQNPSTEIKAVVNNNFLKKFNKKVGDKISVFIGTKKIKIGGQDGLKAKNWVYEDQNGKEIPLEELDDDVRFYTGSELNNSYNWEIKDQKIKYQGKNVKILYQNENGEFKPWLDIERIKVKLNNQWIKPFVKDSEAERIFLGTKINVFTQWIRDGIITNRKSNISEFKKINLKIVDQIQEINTPRIFINQGTLNQILKWPTTKSKHNQYKWFNGRFNQNKKIVNFMFNIPFSTKYGYFDSQVIDSLKKKGIFDSFKIESPLIKKKIINTLTDYLMKLVIIFLVSQFLMIIFFCVFLIINITKSLEKNALELKLLGYPKKVILLQLIQVIFLPFIIGFILGTIAVKALVSYIIQYISQIIDFKMDFDESFWWIFLGFTILMIILIFLLWRNNRQLKRVNLSKLIKGN